MIEKRISLKIETGGAKAELDSIKKSLAGIDNAMPSGKENPFKSSTTGAKTARKALIDYKGSLDNSNRVLLQSTNYATLAEKASLTHDTALRRLNKTYDEGKIDVTQYTAAVAEANKRNAYAVSQLNKTTTATGKSAAGFKVMRGGLSQISYQLQDVAVQAQMGTSWFTIIGQQGPQIASILGPLGAVLGIVVAVGAALGGVLYKSLNLATDGVEELEDSMSELDKAFKIGRNGAIAYTDSIVNIGNQSFNVADLQVVSAVLEATKIIQGAGNTIESILSETLSSKFDLSDYSFGDVQKSLSDLSKAGLTATDAINGIDAVTIKATKNLSKSNKTIYEQRQAIVQAESAARVFRDSISDMAEDLGISAVEAATLSNSLNSLEKASTVEEIQGLQNGLTAFAKQAVNSKGATDSQKESLVLLISSVVDFSEKLKISTKLSNQFNGISTETYRRLPSLISQSTLASAQFNSELSNVAELVTDYVDLEDSFNKLAAASDGWNIDAQYKTMTAFVEKVKENAAELDTIYERTALINGLRQSGIDLDQESIAYIQQYAQEQNYVYEKQLSYNNSLKDNARILSETFTQGASDYAESVGTMNEGLQDLVSGTFSSMEDSLVSWAETGKSSFKDFVNSAISDLLRLMLQQQLAGIAASISGGETASITSTTSGNAVTSPVVLSANAKGGAFSRFATGGVTGMVNSVQSTPKYFANGSGLLGESGQSEAIVPLTRTSGGDLGIKSVGSSSPTINFNVTNESGIESSQTQTTNSDGSITFDVVNKMVAKSIASGSIDKIMKTRYGTSKAGK